MSLLPVTVNDALFFELELPELVGIILFVNKNIIFLFFRTASFCHCFMTAMINFEFSVSCCCFIYLNTELVEFCLENGKFLPILDLFFQIRWSPIITMDGAIKAEKNRCSST